MPSKRETEGEHKMPSISCFEEVVPISSLSAMFVAVVVVLVGGGSSFVGVISKIEIIKQILSERTLYARRRSLEGAGMSLVSSRQVVVGMNAIRCLFRAGEWWWWA